MGERKIAIGNVAECDAIRMLEGITEVPQDGEVRVLPDHNCAGRYRQRDRNQPLDGRW